MTKAEIDAKVREIHRQYGELVDSKRYAEASALFKSQTEDMQNRLLWLAFDRAYDEHEYEKHYA